MARGIERCRIFRGSEDYGDFLARLGTILQGAQVRCYAWALLPNHFHLLLRSGEVPLSRVMRSLMTGYAVAFNRRHRRKGHLFQNRYKSVICEEDPYLLELVRYIHLNPLRAGLVRDVSGLEDYRWTGHSVLMGRQSSGFQEVEDLLGRFSGRGGHARENYRRFVEEGMKEKKRLDFEGGGLGRSLALHGGDGGKGALRKGEVHDDRILGRGDFVEEVIRKTGSTLPVKRFRIPIYELAERVLGRLKVEPDDLFSGRRKGEVSRARALVSYLAVHEMGYHFAEVGEALRVHPVTVARCLERGKEVFSRHGDVLEGL